jgi:hypothetical protein
MNWKALLIAACIMAGFATRGEASAADHRLEICFIDVEGGGATLIVTPLGESVLIDSGSPGPRDAGRIQRAAAAEGVTRIDFFILTHFHLDHFGGIAELASLMPVGQVYDRGIPVHDPDHGPSDAFFLSVIGPYRSFVAAGRNPVAAGLRLPLKDDPAGPRMALLCVASGGRFIDPPAGARPNPLAAENTHHDLAPSDNDLSSAWVLDFGPFRFWDGGDLTWNMEGDVVTPVNRVGQVDVYQVDHHGLGFSNNPVLIHSLAPTVSVMNNGATKGTAATTVAALKSSPGIQAMFQMHKNLRPEDPQDNTEDACIANFAADPNHPDANVIRLSVDPDGASYTVSVPATGFSRSFQTRRKD